MGLLNHCKPARFVYGGLPNVEYALQFKFILIHPDIKLHIA
jgi:hypothetical protein